MSIKVFFLYNRDWNKEIEDYYCGKVPSHRLFGFNEVKELGHQAFTCTISGMGKKIVSRPLLWRVYQAVQTVIKQKKVDCIVATHEAAALPVLLLKRLGLLKTPVVVINVALLAPANLRGRKSTLWKKLLPCAEAIVSYSSTQIDSLAVTFNLDRNRLIYIPLGVDTDYFAPGPSEKGEYLLSVGTNAGKDYATLIKALPFGEKLIVVTDSPNATIIAQNISEQHRVEVRQDVPIMDLRSLYQNAKLHIIPLHETSFSTGQTVLLENMALGKPMIVTQTKATQDYIKNDITALCVEAGNSEQMNQRIREFLDNPERYSNIGIQAAQHVRSQFSARHFAEALVGVIENVKI